MKRSSFFLLLFACISITSWCQVPANRLQIEPVTEHFYVHVTFQKFGSTLFPSNGMYAVTDEGVILFDTPWDEKQFQPLLDSIEKKHGKKVIMSISTHSHDDRAAGIGYYNSTNITTYAHFLTNKILADKNEPLAKKIFRQDTTFNIAGLEFLTYYPGAGHAPDNIVIWFPEQRILYGGCLIKSTEAKTLGNIADADLVSWKKGIERLQTTYEPNYIITGHQDWKDKNSLQHTLNLLNKALENN